MGLVAWAEQASEKAAPVPPAAGHGLIPQEEFASDLLDPSAARREHPVLYLVPVIQITKADSHVREGPVLQLGVYYMMPVAHLFGAGKGVIICITVERLIRAETRIVDFDGPVRVCIVGREGELFGYYGVERR